MILIVSGRTDVLAFYSNWFIKRYQEGFIDVRNPYNPKLVSRINFDNVDAIMFCTKNPIPILNKIKIIKKPMIFHITLTPYKKDIEPNVPNKKEIIEAIKKLSQLIGKDKVVIRYDPVFLNDRYTLEYHKRAFDKMCKLLDGYTNKIIISFIDYYKNVKKNLNQLKIKDFTKNDYKEIGISFSGSAKKHGMTVQTCYEEETLIEYGFIKGECLSHELAYQLTGKSFPNWKARNCNCVEMVDIGAYNTCNHLCKYCYANFDEKQVQNNIKKHNPNSSLLIGELELDDIIKERYI